MIIKKVALKSYRNHKDSEITFQDGLNVICGENGSGKTNVLESIFVAGIGRSPRTNNDDELVRWDEDKAYIYITLDKKYRSHRINIEIDKKAGKKIVVDGASISRLGELVGLLGIVYFSPEELKMIKEAPSERRRFMDISLSQQNKAYFYALNKYNKLIQQRNKLIKEADYAEFSQTAFIWETQIAEQAAIIIDKRRDFINKISVIADKYHRLIAGENEDLVLEYEPCSEYNKPDEIKADVIAKMDANHQKDYELRFTSFGPHREDFKISTRGIELRKFGSQGQQRSAALAIKLAEIEYYYTEAGEKPVLLLDDVLSELDEKRRAALIKATASSQTIITCTEFEEKVENYNLIKIKQGQIIE